MCHMDRGNPSEVRRMFVIVVGFVERSQSGRKSAIMPGTVSLLHACKTMYNVLRLVKLLCCAVAHVSLTYAASDIARMMLDFHLLCNKDKCGLQCCSNAMQAIMLQLAVFANTMAPQSKHCMDSTWRLS